MGAPENQPTPRVSDDSLTQHVEHHRPVARHGWGVVLLVLTLIGALGAAAAYLLTLKEEIDVLRGESRDLNDALELHRSSVDELDTELTACEDELTSEKVVRVERDRHHIALKVCEQNLHDLEAQQEEARARLEEFESLTSRFQGMIDTGQLDVVFRRGQMIVELPAAVLFPSGSDEVSGSGRRALEDVAEILKEMPSRRFTVAGHTDNVPVGEAPFDNNWDLSTSRAVAVTEELIDSGLAGRNLVAAGYSEYAPVAPNRTRRGRQQNRRIEIILEPDLSPVLETQVQ